jgi:hypothetical protein
VVSGWFRKKPVVVEAVRFTGANIEEIAAFVGETPPHRNLALLGESSLYEITTLEGKLFASPGDWIIRGVQGEHYPCKPDIFEETYEPAERPAGAPA